MSTKLGKAKRMHKITLKDCLDHPIWVNTYDEKNYDEEYERPVLSSTANVTRELVTMYTPAITCKVEGQDVHAVGQYAHKHGDLFAIAMWIKNKWQGPEDIKGLKTPLTLIAIPKILGQEGVRFVLKRATDPTAKRLA